ncbi:Glycine-rich domain-containing protein-like [Quillaja saponaria]|uniref:Glycine-rich domain-containing protein-like n=1 Tax=Quillaja saponaria TaxID=32244 RepID=A0AAD7VF41_QUISA|nr:Glycine-rich domain-containing protein-like [Quillaja saponaria]
MSAASRSGSDISANSLTRSLTETSEIDKIRLGLDLVSAARRIVGFLRTVAESQWLHLKPIVVEAIRRYDQLWMPLISDLTVVGSTPPVVLPPIDVEWVWFCHTLNPVSYKQYCEARFSQLIGKPAILNEENEEYALMRCSEIWKRKYPSESFENEAFSISEDQIVVTNEDLFKEIEKQRLLYLKFSEPYMSEIVYLIAAKQRYKAFLYILQSCTDGFSRLVPTLDIMLMWLTHQSYPTIYLEDLNELEGEMGKVVTVSETPNEKEFEETKKLWEGAFDQPYEKAGGAVALTLQGSSSEESPVYWEESDTDANTKYKSMHPRFLLEVCVFVRLKSGMKATQQDKKCDFLRLRTVRCHSELKLDKILSSFPYDSWRKAWHLYCEFGTKGVILEYYHHGANCFKGCSLQDSVTFHWNDLVRASSQTLRKEVTQQVTFIVSITPPVQASYLLKCVPDRVTDDSGAMISDVILRMNRYRPQEGRWLSRTVLDHAGRECFVIRIRIGGGFWRRGGETPSTLKWEDRIVEIREGSWSYVAGSIGRAPEKVVATATPKEPSEQWKAAWCFSTGDELMIHWESTSGLSFCMRNQTSPESSVKLLKGKHMQYQAKKIKSKSINEESHNKGEETEEDESGFLTLVRFTEENLIGKATALLNWKLLVVEFLPEEDAVLMLLLCVSILRSVSEMKKEDVGNLLIRRRLKETKKGNRDWGSVILHPSSSTSSMALASPYVKPWYWNAEAVIASDEREHITRQPALSHSAVEGSDKLYKDGVIS